MAKAPALQLTSEQLEAARILLAETEAQQRHVKRALIARKARDNLIDFTRLMMPDPDDPDDPDRSRYIVARHHEAIARALEGVEAGLLPRLILAVPPRHGKSQLASRMLPAWFLGRNPYQSVIVSTYNQEYADDFGREVRSLVRAPNFKEVFPGFSLRQGSAASDRIQTNEGGMGVFVGRGGAITGRGADLAIIDDPIKDADEAASPTIRDKLWRWFTSVFTTRLMTSQARMMIIQTRWHEDDLIGRLTDPQNPCYSEQEARRWKIIHLPALAEDNDPLGRAPGEPLWPGRFDRDFLEAQRNLDGRSFAALYQGRPSPEEGDFFKAAYIKPYKAAQLPRNLRYYVASDHAVSTAQTADLTCIVVAGVDDENRIWVVETWWRRASTDVVVEAMLDVIRRYKPLAWFAEKGHISKSIGPFLRKRMLEEQVFAAVHEQTPVNDKMTRAQSIQGRMAQGQVYLPDYLPWYQAARHELLTFPNATHDDFVDAMAHLGLGLSSLVSAGRLPPPRPAEPNPGTMAWVKWAHNEEMRERRRQKRIGVF